MTKISDLPLATSPLTGNESLLMLQGTQNVKAAVGVTQVLATYGGLPTTDVTGRVINVMDGEGGRKIAYWNGSRWNWTTLDQVTLTGLGIWVLGIKAPRVVTGVNAFVALGTYYVSQDGFTWAARFMGVATNGINSFSYADGFWIACGTFRSGASTRAFIATSKNPINDQSWITVYTGNTGSLTAPAFSFDNTTGIFQVPVVESNGTTFNVAVTNTCPATDEPDPSWPTISPNIGDSMPGVGIQGPVEARVNETTVVVNAGALAIATEYVQAKKSGTGDWQPVRPEAIAGLLATLPTAEPTLGLHFAGPVWGIIKELACEFAPGGT